VKTFLMENIGRRLGFSISGVRLWLQSLDA
jgi:hypothetical protein